MSLAEDFQPRGILPGSTDQNPVAQGNVERRLAIIPDMAIQDPDPFENLEKLLDFPAQKRYSLHQARARSMIDGILTVSGLIFTAIMAAPFVIEELYQLIGMFKLGVEHEHQPTYLFVLMFFTTCIATLISLQLTKGEKR